jgi:hypothetical protein
MEIRIENSPEELFYLEVGAKLPKHKNSQELGSNRSASLL